MRVSAPWAACVVLCLAFGPREVVAYGQEIEFPGLEVLESRGDGAVLFALRNPQRAELTVSLEFTLQNLTPTVPVPFQIVLAPQHTTPPLVALRPTDPGKPWHFSYRSHFTWGSPQASHASHQLYHLPFAPGRSFRVVQGNGGLFSHQGEDQFGFDFAMPEGTPVLAAREGLVVLVRDGFNTGAPDPAYKKRANVIFVRHADATIGEYLHLLRGGMKVKIGDTVQPGQVLALSGNSGYTQGPHLHFMVFRARDSKSRESLPIQFVTREGSGLVLEQGKSYTASPLAVSPQQDWLK